MDSGYTKLPCFFCKQLCPGKQAPVLAWAFPLKNILTKSTFKTNLNESKQILYYSSLWLPVKTINITETLKNTNRTKHYALITLSFFILIKNALYNTIFTFTFIIQPCKAYWELEILCPDLTSLIPHESLMQIKNLNN